MTRVKTLFRYVGNKAKLLKIYSPFFEGLRPQHCIDYFGGSGTISLWFHQLYPEAKLYLNEIDPALYSLFKCIQEEYERFCDEIFDLQRTNAVWKGIESKKRLYYAIRGQYNGEFDYIIGDNGHELRYENEEDRNELTDLGYIDFGDLEYEVFKHACYLFLRKLSFSGFNLRNRDGEYTTSAGIRSANQPCYDPKALADFKAMLDHAVLLNTDYREVDIPLPRTLHYFDPPYVQSDNLYPFHCHWAQTEELCEYLQRVSEHSTVFMSNEDHPRLKKWMKGFDWYSF